MQTTTLQYLSFITVLFLFVLIKSDIAEIHITLSYPFKIAIRIIKNKSDNSKKTDKSKIIKNRKIVKYKHIELYESEYEYEN